VGIGTDGQGKEVALREGTISFGILMPIEFRILTIIARLILTLVRKMLMGMV